MKKLILSLILQLGVFLTVPSVVLADNASEPNLEQTFNSLAIKFIIGTGLIIAVVVILTFIIKNESENLKKLFFGLIVLPTILTSAFLISSTVYLNVKSESKGPVHWHADFEIWNCGQRLDIKNPSGWSNKVGTSTLHEHNDGRVHVEGVVLKKEDVSFGNFIRVIGGKISSTGFEIPTTDGIVKVNNGDYCNDYQEARLQAFVYTVQSNTYSQKKVENIASYVPNPETVVPPGDCIIIEFDQEKEKTDKLCEQYQVKKQLGELHGD